MQPIKKYPRNDPGITIIHPRTLRGLLLLTSSALFLVAASAPATGQTLAATGAYALLIGAIVTIKVRHSSHHMAASLSRTRGL